MTYEELPWDKRQEFHRRSASLNKLADAFGLAFTLKFDPTEPVMVFIKLARCEVPHKDWGQP
jgi:hypothetical protein